MRSLNIKTVEGTSEANYSVGDTDGTAKLTVANTPVPASGCPASSSWQDFLGFECRGGGVGQAQVHLLGPVP
ncbi:hypothetical protein GCM10009762_25690 [Dermacoccus barathri]|uniref:Uncharacterized protein n=2 Tax=Dermacoccus barathri TaxID=322601 RepID=A0ABN2C320_9MICO